MVGLFPTATSPSTASSIGRKTYKLYFFATVFCHQPNVCLGFREASIGAVPSWLSLLFDVFRFDNTEHTHTHSVTCTRVIEEKIQCLLDGKLSAGNFPLRAFRSIKFHSRVINISLISGRVVFASLTLSPLSEQASGWRGGKSVRTSDIIKQRDARHFLDEQTRLKRRWREENSSSSTFSPWR